MIPNSILFNKTSSGNRANKCPLAGADIEYKNLELLKKFISKGGRILPRRLTGVSAGNQRKLSHAIKIARILALLPFVQS
jgi:small subunit ribosomal protein S18